MTATKKIFCVLLGVGILLGCYFWYMARAFPEVPCTDVHSSSP